MDARVFEPSSPKRTGRPVATVAGRLRVGGPRVVEPVKPAWRDQVTDGTGAESAQDVFDWTTAQRVLTEAASTADDGEIYLEDARSESFVWDDGRLRQASYSARRGFGLRIVSGGMAGYGHSSNL